MQQQQQQRRRRRQLTGNDDSDGDDDEEEERRMARSKRCSVVDMATRVSMPAGANYRCSHSVHTPAVRFATTITQVACS